MTILQDLQPCYESGLISENSQIFITLAMKSPLLLFLYVYNDFLNVSMQNEHALLHNICFISLHSS